jgi:hypothetical protein
MEASKLLADQGGAQDFLEGNALPEEIFEQALAMLGAKPEEFVMTYAIEPPDVSMPETVIVARSPTQGGRDYRALHTNRLLWYTHKPIY